MKHKSEGIKVKVLKASSGATNSGSKDFTQVISFTQVGGSVVGPGEVMTKHMALHPRRVLPAVAAES